MPNNIRAMLTVTVALVAAVVFYFETQAESGALRWIALALAALMIYGLWLYPEGDRKKDDRP